MSQDKKLKVTGFVHLVLKDAFGNVKYEKSGENIITDAGLAEIAKAIVTDSYTEPSHMAIGSANTAAAAGQTTLGTETSRQSLTSNVRTTNSIAFVGTFPAGAGTGAVEEAGLFNAGSSGSMFCRFLTGTFTKGASDELVITWTLTVARA